MYLQTVVLALGTENRKTSLHKVDGSPLHGLEPSASKSLAHWPWFSSQGSSTGNLAPIQYSDINQGT
jgi:hypothetical protein